MEGGSGSDRVHFHFKVADLSRPDWSEDIISEILNFCLPWLSLCCSPVATFERMLTFPPFDFRETIKSFIFFPFFFLFLFSLYPSFVRFHEQTRGHFVSLDTIKSLVSQSTRNFSLAVGREKKKETLIASSNVENDSPI